MEGVWARISCVLNMDSSVNFGFGAKYPLTHQNQRMYNAEAEAETEETFL